MRVCIISHILRRTDGQGRVNYATAAHLARCGHEVVLVAAELDPPLRDAPNVTWIRVPIPRRLPTALLKEQVFALRVRRAVRAEIRRGGPFDIVQMNGCAAYVDADVNVANFVHADWMKSPYHTARARGGIYGLYHRFYTWINILWERRAYHRASAVVAVSDIIKQSLIDDVGVDRARIHVLPPGVDAEEFQPLAAGQANQLRTMLGVPENELLLLFAGDARTNRKNLDLVIEATAMSGIRCHLAVAGRVAERVYGSMAKELGIEGRVHLLGMRSDLPSLMRCADVLAFPSHYDPFALVVTEAMASGLVPIVPPSVGASSVIQSGENGFVLRDSADLDGFIAILHRLNKDRALLAKMSAAARATAENLSWESMARKYESLYRAVAAAKYETPRLSPATAGVGADAGVD